MKKGLLFILLAAASVCLPAQEKENAAKSYTVETNRFGANWFISGGIGAQMYFGDNDGKADFGKRLAPALDIAVGKWFTPVSYTHLEEGKHLDYEVRRKWDTLWIVDPLDGTKEFIKRNGEFTVNIALVQNSVPVLGLSLLHIF